MGAWTSIGAAALLVCVSSGMAAANEPPRPLFAGDDPIHLTVRGQIGKVAGNRNENSWTKATLTVEGVAPEALAVTLSPRGITRRAQDICQFPPLRVEFDQPPGDNSLFAGQKKLKLVTHCKSDPAFQQYVLLEYAAYRMYNLLTPISFGVRLATIDYVETNGKLARTRLGFFIEDPKGVAQRNGLKQAKVGARISPTALRARDAARGAVFEYLIGNLDWAFNAGPPGAECCHNGRLFGAPDAVTNLAPVPYDFDFSGMVDAPYATPPAAIPLANVRVRQFRGYCRLNAETRAVIAEVVAQRSALLAILDATPQLADRPRAKAAAYLGGFFDAVATPKGMQDMLKTCT